MKFPRKLMLVIASSCLALAQGCAHIERAEYDPCADQTSNRPSRSARQIIACYSLEIPFRLTVVDATTRTTVPGAIAVDDWYLPAPPGEEDGRFGTSREDGIIQGVAWTLTGVANPYTNACFRSKFRGILVEIRKDGYAYHREYVGLPAAEGDVVDLGTIKLVPVSAAEE